MVIKNPRPYKTGTILVLGLICCKNGCSYWNKDVNSATNIYKIAYNAINDYDKERPSYLSRSNNKRKFSGNLEDYSVCEKIKFPLVIFVMTTHYDRLDVKISLSNYIIIE